jgi:hypothetical protein
MLLFFFEGCCRALRTLTKLSGERAEEAFSDDTGGSRS